MQRLVSACLATQVVMTTLKSPRGCPHVTLNGDRGYRGELPAGYRLMPSRKFAAENGGPRGVFQDCECASARPGGEWLRGDTSIGLRQNFSVVQRPAMADRLERHSRPLLGSRLASVLEFCIQGLLLRLENLGLDENIIEQRFKNIQIPFGFTRFDFNDLA